MESEGGAPLRYHVYTPEGLLLYSLEAADDGRRVYHYDEMGSTLFVTDGAAQLVQRYAYAPYGEVLAESGGLGWRLVGVLLGDRPCRRGRGASTGLPELVQQGDAPLAHRGDSSAGCALQLQES